MQTQRGAHICALYSTRTELAQLAADFITEGLNRREQCWYVASHDETDLVRRALEDAGIDVDAAVAQNALNLKSAESAYVVHGNFNAEKTLGIFNNAIDAAYGNGFVGFRAAAEMSWALNRPGAVETLIEYEALLRVLFNTCRATGLCLYDRYHMPLEVIGGALATHPFATSDGEVSANPRYDPEVLRLSDVR